MSDIPFWGNKCPDCNEVLIYDNVLDIYECPMCEDEFVYTTLVHGAVAD